MSGLVLKFKAGEALIINGAAIRFRTRAVIDLPSRADILYGKQILNPDQATTPARRLYAALQSAYVTSSEERARHLALAIAFARDLAEATTSPTLRSVLVEIERDALAGRFYAALKACRLVISHEDAVFGLASKPLAHLPHSGSPT
ncbi:MAG: flagellar biosynthesis repressor FlbT [Elioraea sp.]|nr:flagellar biosynthesis repressor FlbT [Elioraea sp.]